MNSEDASSNSVVLDDHVYKLLAGSAAALIVIGAVAYRLLEGWSWVDSIYFSVIAVTTVGFGDITPSTDASKIFTVIYVLTGISIITAYLHARLGRRGSRRIQT
jgi:voltage-gated potassium channel Kch